MVSSYNSNTSFTFIAAWLNRRAKRRYAFSGPTGGLTLPPILFLKIRFHEHSITAKSPGDTVLLRYGSHPFDGANRPLRRGKGNPRLTHFSCRDSRLTEGRFWDLRESRRDSVVEFDNWRWGEFVQGSIKARQSGAGPSIQLFSPLRDRLQ